MMIVLLLLFYPYFAGTHLKITENFSKLKFRFIVLRIVWALY